MAILAAYRLREHPKLAALVIRVVFAALVLIVLAWGQIADGLIRLFEQPLGQAGFYELQQLYQFDVSPVGVRQPADMWRSVSHRGHPTRAVFTSGDCART